MGFLDTTTKVLKSATNILNSMAVNADEQTKKKLKKMPNDELLSLLDKQPANKYVKEEVDRRGI